MALLFTRVAGWVEYMWSRTMVVRRPLVKVIGNIEGSRIGRGIFEINDNYLEIKFDRKGYFIFADLTEANS